MSGVERVLVTALLPDFQMERLTLSQVREFCASLAHLPDDTCVLYVGGSGLSQPYGRCVLQVTEVQAADVKQPVETAPVVGGEHGGVCEKCGKTAMTYLWAYSGRRCANCAPSTDEVQR